MTKIKRKMKKKDELIIVNKKLALQNDEKEKRTAALPLINLEHKNAEEYIQALEQIMHITSHKVRQQIANIIGLSQTLDLLKDPKDEIKQSIDHIKNAAVSLDTLTRELNAHVLHLKQKVKR
jgi:signal transduction histidine kinase